MEYCRFISVTILFAALGNVAATVEDTTTAIISDFTETIENGNNSTGLSRDLGLNDSLTEEGSLATVAPVTTAAVPDDYLNWFFHHAFNKLDEFFQREDENDIQKGSADDWRQNNNWKVRVSKVILKLVLIILAIVSSVLFILGVFLFMIVSFLVFKFLGHIFQCFQENRKYNNSSTTYQVSV